MSSGAQVDLDWAGSDAGQGGAAAPPASTPKTGAAGAAHLTDEEILGLEPASSSGAKDSFVIPSAGTEDSRRGEARLPAGQARNLSSIDGAGKDRRQRDSSGEDHPQNDNNLEGDARATDHESRGAPMPGWMAAAASDPRHGAEAAQLWREHQEFRAAFRSPEEARAVKELLPGGVRDALSLREATQSVERIDAALFLGDARAQAEVVAEMARANPAAFRSMFAEAARVLAMMGESLEARGREAGGREARSSHSSSPVILSEAKNPSDGFAREENPQRDSSGQNRPQNDSALERVENLRLGSKESGLQPPASSHQNFDPATYAAFERATNEAVARDVRGSIHDTLARVMPEGVAEGAARRIGEDIFNEVHRALAADRSLSEQVAGVLRDPARPAGGWRFGGAEQQRVAALLAGRARQLVPSVARRVIGEWTSTVLNTARNKAARQAAAASRVDIAAPGGSLDSMPLRQMSPREVNYASMSDEEILGM